MARLSRDPSVFLERIGYQQCFRAPAPYTIPGLSRILHTEVEEPLPLPDYARRLEGNPPPDRADGPDWPGGRPE